MTGLLTTALEVGAQRSLGEVPLPQPWREEMHVEGGMGIPALEDSHEVDVRINPLHAAGGEEIWMIPTERAPTAVQQHNQV